MVDVTRAYSIEDLRRLARKRLPRAVFEFFDGGAEDEVTLRANRAAFESVRLLPKVLVDVSESDPSTEILDVAARWPFVIAPTGSIGIGWPGADVAIARAAAAFGVPFTLSTMATASIEEVARKAPGRLWFQLYVFYDREFTDKIVARADAAGYEALVITVDLAAGGKRERDMRNAFSMPFRLRPRHVIEGIVRPGWAFGILRHGMPEFDNLRGYQGRADSGLALASSVGRNTDPGLNWDDLARFRDRWKRKLVVKGIARADDAARAVQLGLDAIWVSNHGGRQLDSAVASMEALPAIVSAVNGRVPVILDSGVRRGSDALKALAMGAQAVGLGRAALYGASIAGEAGAMRALEIFTDELSRTMKLCGVRSIAEIGPHLLAAPR